MKRYFETPDSELCYPKEYFRELLGEGDNSLEVFEAQMVVGAGFFFCAYFQEVGQVGEGCGVECDGYSPRNGKNGRCRFSMNTYEPGEQVTLKFKKKKPSGYPIRPTNKPIVCPR